MPLNQGITEFILIFLNVPGRELGFTHFSSKTDPKIVSRPTYPPLFPTDKGAWIVKLAIYCHSGGFNGLLI